MYLDKDISKWSEEDVSSWLAYEGFSEEGPMFAGLRCKRYLCIWS